MFYCATDVSVRVCNHYNFGFMTPPQPRSIKDDLNQLLNAKLMTSSEYMFTFYPL